MSSANELLESLKMELNAVLVSGGRETSLHQLAADYHDIIRKPIPYREAGYTSIVDLVQDIPDAVCSRWINGELRVSAVIRDEKNGRVARLVSLNKVKPKSSYRRMQRPIRFQERPYSMPATSPPTCATIKHRSAPTPTDDPSRPVPLNIINHRSSSTPIDDPSRPVSLNNPSAFAPVNDSPAHVSLDEPSTRLPVNDTVSPASLNDTAADKHKFIMLRGKIMELMLSYRSGLKGSQFVDAFAKRFGNYRILTDTGHESISRLLETMPDVVEVSVIGNGEDFIVRGKRQRDHQTVSSLPNGSVPNASLPPNAMLNKPAVNPCKSFGGDDQDGDANFDEADGLRLNGDDFGAPSNLEELKVKVQQVLSHHPKGLFSSKFLTEFQRVTGQKLNLKKFDCVAVIDLLSLMPDTVVLERPSGGDWILFDKRTFQKELLDYSHSGTCFPPTPTFSDFRLSLRNVLEKYRDGVLLTELENIYQNVVEQSINAKLLGFPNIDKLLTAVDDMIELKYLGNGRVLVKLAKSSSRVGKTPDKELSSLAAFVRCAKDGLPPDAVPFPYVYRDQEPPELFSNNNYVDVQISDVTSPSHFWFQLSSTKHYLDGLMDSLQTFYRHRASEAYAVPSDMLKAGLCCVGFYPEGNEWYRCTVKDVASEDVTVFYVDYGTQATISKSLLRLITWKFLSAIPKQALRGRLCKLEPANGTWSQEACVSFFNMIDNRQLLAAVTDHSNDGGICFSLVLCDTSGAEDVHINDRLFDEGHAVLNAKEFKVDADKDTVSEDRIVDSEDKNVDSDEMLFDSDEDDCGFKEIDEGEKSVAADLRQNAFNVDARPFIPRSSQDQTNRVKESDSVPSHPHLFKFVQLTPKYSMHLLNIEDKPYVISTEVSFFFWKDDDLIRTKLRNVGKANLPKLVLTAEEHSDLIRRLVNSCLPGTAVDGEPREILVLYELSSVITILELFNHESEDLKIAVQQQFDLFNPNDLYWTGRNEVEMLEKCKEHENKYKKSWNSLQKSRQDLILQMKTAAPSQMGSLIAQLEGTEAELESLKGSYEQSHGLDSTSAKSNRSVGLVDVSIGDVILQQGQSYLARNKKETSKDTSNSGYNTAATSISAQANTMPNVETVGANTGTTAPVLQAPLSGVDSLASSLSLFSFVNPLVPPPFRTSELYGTSLLLPGYSAYSAMSAFNPPYAGALFTGPNNPSGLLSPATAFYHAPSGLLPSLSAINYQQFYPGRPL